MGEIAELMLNGTLCQVCGDLMEDLIPDEGNILSTPPGYPRTCKGCKSLMKYHKRKNKKAPIKQRRQP